MVFSHSPADQERLVSRSRKKRGSIHSVGNFRWLDISYELSICARSEAQYNLFTYLSKKGGSKIFLNFTLWNMNLGQLHTCTSRNTKS